MDDSRRQPVHIGEDGHVAFTIYGEPASKANSRRLVTFGNKPAFIKSKKGLQYAEDFKRQCPTLSPLMGGELAFEATIYYASRRPDLDESLILDLMQGRIYENDRQVRTRLVDHDLDRDCPRAEIIIWPRGVFHERLMAALAEDLETLFETEEAHPFRDGPPVFGNSGKRSGPGADFVPRRDANSCSKSGQTGQPQ